jgi:hypothetical protein
VGPNAFKLYCNFSLLFRGCCRLPPQSRRVSLAAAATGNASSALKNDHRREIVATPLLYLLSMSNPLHNSCAAPVAVEGCVEFYVGNPQVSITSGTLHLFKSWSEHPDTLQVNVRSNLRCLFAHVHHCARRSLCCPYPPTSLCRTSSGF